MHSTDDDDSPSVIGTDLPPMPTEADRREAWKLLFIEHAVLSGLLGADSAEDLYNAGNWDYSEAPGDAFDDEVALWDADE